MSVCSATSDVVVRLSVHQRQCKWLQIWLVRVRLVVYGEEKENAMVRANVEEERGLSIWGEMRGFRKPSPTVIKIPLGEAPFSNSIERIFLKPHTRSPLSRR